MRLASWNIRHGSPGEGRPVDLSPVAATLRELDADVVGLQEVDRHGRRSGGVDQAGELARSLGLAAHFAPARPLRGGGWYGNALLVRGAIVAVEEVPLPAAGEPRVLLVARVEPAGWPGRRLTVGITHLQHRRGAPTPEAPAQLAFALTHLLGESGPVVLMGDLNLGPDGVLPVATAAGVDVVSTGPGFPAHRPTRRVDWVLTRGLAGVDGRVVEADASDHLPLVVDVAPRPSAGAGPVADR